MKLTIRASKDYGNEANMRSQRDAILERLAELGFLVLWDVKEG